MEWANIVVLISPEGSTLIRQAIHLILNGIERPSGSLELRDISIPSIMVFLTLHWVHTFSYHAQNNMDSFLMLIC